MKSIMISIKPQYVAKILNGEKTIEVRKRFPLNYRGWVYIYCTKDKRDNLYVTHKWVTLPEIPNLPSIRNGKVIARFYCDNVEKYVNGCKLDGDYSDYEYILKPSCLTEEELNNYCEDLSFYAVHISQLEIFDKPKELSEFYSMNTSPITFGFNENIGGGNLRLPLSKAPQSWQYIEEVE